MAQLMSIKKNVDVQPGVGVPAIFHASQGDKGTRIILGLLNNNDTYTIPEGTTAIIRGSRADGTLFTEITADIDTTTEIKFNLTEDMTSVAGPVECEAVMTSGTANVIGTANFIINIEKSPASIGSVFPGTDAAETWLIDELTNLDISGLDDESVVDAINSKLEGTFETTDAGKVLMVNNDGSVSPATVDLSGKANESTIAPEFSDQNTYTAGSYVYKNGVLYKFTAAHSGAWTGTDAETVTVGGEVEEAKSVARNYEKYILENEELLSSASWVENYYISATGVLTSSNAAHYTGLIPVENKVYLFVYVSNGVNNNTRIHGYDENGQWVKQIVVSASGTNTNPIMVDVPVSSDIKYIRLSINKVVTPVVFAIKKETTVADIDKLSKEVLYVLNTDSVVKYGIDFGTSDIYSEGYLYSTYNCVGKTINTVSKSGNGNFKYYKIDVSRYIKVFFPCIKSSQLYGELFENSNGVICGFYTNSELDAKTIVGVDVPEGAQYLYLCDDNRWDDADLLFIGVISTIKSGGGSGTVIVHDDSYPSLTASEKSQIVSLCDNYHSIREVFRYGGTRYRNQYINNDCIVDGKFVINCGMFAQFIWMGRQASDFNLSNYSNRINKAFDWGYYFDFAIHKAIYGLAKNASATDASAKYYGYQAPGGSDPYAFNAYTQDDNMVWRYFMAAADLAEELYNMGCEVPRRAAEVGDLVFYRGPEYSGMTLETQLNFRNISHVGVITDIDYLGSGRMRTTEVTFRSDMGTVAHLSINENDNSDKTRAGFYENRIVMIARHPHAFGIASNVPEFITEI